MKRLLLNISRFLASVYLLGNVSTASSQQVDSLNTSLKFLLYNSGGYHINGILFHHTDSSITLFTPFTEVKKKIEQKNYQDLVAQEFKAINLQRIAVKKKSKIQGLIIGSIIGFGAGYYLASSDDGLNLALAGGLFLGAPLGGSIGLTTGSRRTILELKVNRNVEYWKKNRHKINELLNSDSKQKAAKKFNGIVGFGHSIERVHLGFRYNRSNFYDISAVSGFILSDRFSLGLDNRLKFGDAKNSTRKAWYGLLGFDYVTELDLKGSFLSSAFGKNFYTRENSGVSLELHADFSLSSDFENRIGPRFQFFF